MESDEENAENEVAPVEERESSEEEAGGSSDELTDTHEQESRHPLWARTSTYVVFSSVEPQIQSLVCYFIAISMPF